jgi:hypothetical protein
MQKRLIFDVAEVMALAGMHEPWVNQELPPEERYHALLGTYTTALEAYEYRKSKEQHRLKPCRRKK